jgi:hypothetical protein
MMAKKDGLNAAGGGFEEVKSGDVVVERNCCELKRRRSSAACLRGI